MSVRGHLRLTADIDESGRSFLREQSFSAPVHLGKSYLDCGVLSVQVVCPTAGLLEGDTLDLDVRVAAGAWLLLINPAATRVHTMKGGVASVRQKISVAAGGWLMVWPDLFIPQSGARYEQKTEIVIERGGELLFLEIMTPGRVASGESFAFDRLDWETDIFWDKRQIVRERYVLSPATASLYALQTPFAQTCQANCFVLSASLQEESACWAGLNALHGDDLWIGYSRLSQGGWVIKMLARDSLVLRAALEKVRALLHAAAGWPLAASRRV